LGETANVTWCVPGDFYLWLVCVSVPLWLYIVSSFA
jgi:hypothetical protein